MRWNTGLKINHNNHISLAIFFTNFKSHGYKSVALKLNIGYEEQKAMFVTPFHRPKFTYSRVFNKFEMFHTEFKFVVIRFYKKNYLCMITLEWTEGITVWRSSWETVGTRSYPIFFLVPYINLYRNDFPSWPSEGTWATVQRKHVLKAATDKRRENSTRRWCWNGWREWKEANFSPSLPICYKEIFPENSLLRDAGMSLSFT